MEIQKKQTSLTKSQTVNQFQQKYQINKEYQQKSKTNIPNHRWHIFQDV